MASCLSAEAVQSAALSLEGVHDVHGSDGLATAVLGVGHSVTDDVLQENLEDGAGLLVDEAADALDTTTASKTADSRLGDALDVVTQHLAVTLGATLSESFSSFATTRHCLCVSMIGTKRAPALKYSAAHSGRRRGECVGGEHGVMNLGTVWVRSTHKKLGKRS